MAGVFDRLVGQGAVESELTAAAVAARGGAGSSSAMTHSWLFTGPPGSGRSVAALCFAAALQCTDEGTPGCGRCHACTTTVAGTHGDVRRVVPEGLSIGTKEMREIVQVASRRPSTGRWQVVVVEDADRLTEAAGNVLLKVVEEPPERTVFLLCAPSVDPEDISVTLRSRCRHVHLATPSVDSIARVLRERDGLDERTAGWAAGVSGGHIGRARRLATDDQARARRKRALALVTATARPAAAYAAADELVKSADDEAKQVSAERDEKEREELAIALGAGGTGKGAASATRSSAGALKELEKRQKSRATRTGRDALDRALIDVAGLYRDALAVRFGAAKADSSAGVVLTHPDMADQIRELATDVRPEGLLLSIQAVLDCREALETNVKPRFALAAMAAALIAARSA
ncbi:DNA polymerase III subunit delta' [Nocardia seriolae]|uniref:DNA-directed DNA polymerase n=1 Tax=Nocardia seriolae TaxID=37332 RepID=A0ABC8AK67_9NOCA|nr:DNA polymerase III subunit delta' [Nocardia seriolae]APA94450.1 DNA-directed DNA polymerase [Nocardia seriolae]MTJ60397.1 DNA polymerase III subunit delta' [Nocardia seriolae]MTJ73808.1 DNA polymerase III subunit delta' [Nocardia seriolae]MTJ84768.1 DNA polymerase III subunit delta' [Nocardia seriolae]MTK28756.1 DNA polymerase III subunit delta' [Nocardia seriolae]